MDWRELDALRTLHRRELNCGMLCRAAFARTWWWAGPPLAIFAIIATVVMLRAPVYSAEAQISIASWTHGLVGLRASAASLEAGCASTAGPARLMSSRELARRAIKDLGIEDDPEFASAAADPGPGLRALVFLGILSDPSRQSKEERILEAFQERLRVSGSNRRNMLTVAFRSHDRELAANAANRVAELYLDLGAGASKAPCAAAARIVSRALPPSWPLYPRATWLLLSGAAALVIGIGAGIAAAWPRLPPAIMDDPAEQPRHLGRGEAVVPVRDSAPFAPGPDPVAAPRATDEYPDHGQAVAEAVARILPARSHRSARVLMTSLRASGAASCLKWSLTRNLARKAHTIVVELDSADCLERGADTFAGKSARPTLGELLSGAVSFAEAIRRDRCSRLHFLQLDCGGEFDPEGFAIVLDALGATYGFIVLAAAPMCGSGAAKAIAAAADLAVLTADGEPAGAIFDARRVLIESGAPDVLSLDVARDVPEGAARNAKAAQLCTAPNGFMAQTAYLGGPLSPARPRKLGHP